MIWSFVPRNIQALRVRSWVTCIESAWQMTSQRCLPSVKLKALGVGLDSKADWEELTWFIFSPESLVPPLLTRDIISSWILWNPRTHICLYSKRYDKTFLLFLSDTPGYPCTWLLLFQNLFHTFPSWEMLVSHFYSTAQLVVKNKAFWKTKLL